jgi:hypothetical protein
MSLYSQKLLDYVSNINSPIKTTSTTTLQQPNEGLDISSLLMMLMMGQMFKKPTAVSPNQSALNLLSQQNLPPAAGAMGGGTDNILQLLSSLGPLLGK